MSAEVGVECDGCGISVRVWCTYGRGDCLVCVHGPGMWGWVCRGGCVGGGCVGGGCVGGGSV